MHSGLMLLKRGVNLGLIALRSESYLGIKSRCNFLHFCNEG